MRSRGHGDHAVARLASLQHGVVTSAQLRYALGLTHPSVTRRLQRGGLVRLHQGAYLVGVETPSRRGEMAAAVLACGPDAAISHLAAAESHAILPQARGPLDVTAPTGRRRRGGIRTHRAHLASRDRRIVARIPITAPARTLLDLAATTPGALSAALNEARLRRIIDLEALAELRGRTLGHRGWKELGRLLLAESGEGFSRSRAEGRMRELIASAGLPAPERNVRWLGHEHDFLWREIDLAVEVDSYTWHGTRDRMNADRDRDTELAAHGVQVLRITWDQLRDAPEVTARRLAAVLTLRARTP